MESIVSYNNSIVDSVINKINIDGINYTASIISNISDGNITNLTYGYNYTFPVFNNTNQKEVIARKIGNLKWL